MTPVFRPLLYSFNWNSTFPFIFICKWTLCCIATYHYIFFKDTSVKKMVQSWNPQVHCISCRWLLIYLLFYTTSLHIYLDKEHSDLHFDISNNWKIIHSQTVMANETEVSMNLPRAGSYNPPMVGSCRLSNSCGLVTSFTLSFKISAWLYALNPIWDRRSTITRSGSISPATKAQHSCIKQLW